MIGFTDFLPDYSQKFFHLINVDCWLVEIARIGKTLLKFALGIEFPVLMDASKWIEMMGNGLRRNQGKTITLTTLLCAATLSGPLRAEMPEPVDQALLNEIQRKDVFEAFIYAFEAGDELTEAVFATDRGAGSQCWQRSSIYSFYRVLI